MLLTRLGNFMTVAQPDLPGVADAEIGVRFEKEQLPLYLLGLPEVVRVEEGCLSIPDLRVDVDRPEGLIVDFTDLEGTRQSIEVHDLVARVILHENDHLDGILLVDRINPVRRRLLNKQLKQMARSQKRARAVA